MSDHSAAAKLSSAEDAGDISSADSHTRYLTDPSSLSSDDDESAIDHLMLSEPNFMPRPDYIRPSVDLAARQDSINWILKVHAHYQFRPVTAVLSVTYFDRFLSCHSLQKAYGWPFQLLSVACLSLAAKMEEPHVPLLIDLQLFEPRFIFEPKTIQRMELRVMANLSFRLRSVTPFDFLHYFVSKVPFSKPDIVACVSRKSSDLIICTVRVIDFLGISPSIIAAAAVTLAVEGFELPETFYERVDKRLVTSCHQLMKEYLIDTCPSAHLKFCTDEPTLPLSPINVLDAAVCVSCSGTSLGSGSGEAEPPSKAATNLSCGCTAGATNI